jgi:hypothetical protein
MRSTSLRFSKTKYTFVFIIGPIFFHLDVLQFFIKVVGHFDALLLFLNLFLIIVVVLVLFVFAILLRFVQLVFILNLVAYVFLTFAVAQPSWIVVQVEFVHLIVFLAVIVHIFFGLVHVSRRAKPMQLDFIEHKRQRVKAFACAQVQFCRSLETVSEKSLIQLAEIVQYPVCVRIEALVLETSEILTDESIYSFQI